MSVYSLERKLQATKVALKLLNDRFQEEKNKFIENNSAKTLTQRSQLDFLTMIYQKITHTFEKVVAL